MLGRGLQWAFALSLAARAIYGQAINGSVVGNIKHSSEAVIVGAPVSVTKPETRHTRGTSARYLAADGGDHSPTSTRVDGATTMNVWLPDIVAMVPTLESIATVNVSTNSFDAETGFTGGGSIGVQTKSGTDQLHGALFEDHTNNNLKAQPFFLLANQQKGNMVYHEFGGTFDANIIRAKSF